MIMSCDPGFDCDDDIIVAAEKYFFCVCQNLQVQVVVWAKKVVDTLRIWYS